MNSQMRAVLPHTQMERKRRKRTQKIGVGILQNHKNCLLENPRLEIEDVRKSIAAPLWDWLDSFPICFVKDRISTQHSVNNE
jgi:hypothetical protein